MSVMIKGAGRSGGSTPISQISSADLDKKLKSASGMTKVKIINELTKRGA